MMAEYSSGIALRLVIFLEAFGSSLYFLAFPFFYLIDRGYSAASVSLMIASTALLNALWGPVASRAVDRWSVQSTFPTFLFGASSLMIFMQAAISEEIVLILPAPAYWVLILLFALAYNPLVSFLTQYLYPRLHSSEAEAYSLSQKTQAVAAFLAGAGLFFWYEIGPRPFIFLSSIIFCTAGVVLYLLVKPPESADTSEELDTPERIFVIDEIKRLWRYWFLFILVLVFAFTETSFVVNFEVLGIALGQTPIAIIFLIAAFQAAISLLAAHFYPNIFSRRDASNRYILSVIIYICVAAFTTLSASHAYIGGSVAWGSIALPLCLTAIVVAGEWWGILSIMLIRRLSSRGKYAETAAYFKMPRAVVTFFGIVLLGKSVEDGMFSGLMALNGCLLVAALALSRQRLSTLEQAR